MPVAVASFSVWLLVWHLTGCCRIGLYTGYKDSIVLSWRWFIADAKFKMGETRSLEDFVKMYVSPNEGGCWFCSRADLEMFFSSEFDCYFHIDCLKRALGTDDAEAKLIAREFGISDNGDNIS